MKEVKPILVMAAGVALGVIVAAMVQPMLDNLLHPMPVAATKA